MSGKRAVTVGVVALAVLAAYPLLLRRRFLTWGASAEEVRRRMPGDELLSRPDTIATRAVTIEAPPSAVWPWLAQMGRGRGGAYAYDWIENLLGLSRPSVEDIIHGRQELKVGDLLPVGPDSAVMRVEILEPERVLGIRSEDGTWVWLLALYPDGQRTRLVSRNRIAAPDTSAVGRLVNLFVMEPGSLLVERKMLLGIRQRAEALARRDSTAARQPAGPTPSVRS